MPTFHNSEISRKYAIEHSQKAVRDAYTPATYAHNDSGRIISAEEYDALLHTAADDAARLADARQLAFQQGTPLSDDDDGDAAAIQNGPWVGFTRADAQQWCWELLHSEPIHSSNTHMLVIQSKQQLLAGELPAFARLADRAGELRLHGVTPAQYEQHLEAVRALQPQLKLAAQAIFCLICNKDHSKI